MQHRFFDGRMFCNQFKYLHGKVIFDLWLSAIILHSKNAALFPDIEGVLNIAQASIQKTNLSQCPEACLTTLSAR